MGEILDSNVKYTNQFELKIVGEYRVCTVCFFIVMASMKFCHCLVFVNKNWLDQSEWVRVGKCVVMTVPQ